MKDRLVIFMHSEGLNASQLADKVNVQASSISHILSGRNNPSFDFVAKLIRAFPDLNAKWLITGEGNIYAPGNSEGNIPQIKDPQLEGLFDFVGNINNDKEIDKIVVLYTDKSFDVYHKK